jgi:tetratricopeptide (TPR) repeat protein
MRRRDLACAILFALLAIGPAGRAGDAPPAAPPGGSEVAVTIELKDGRVLEGVLVSETKDQIVIRMPFGEIPVARTEIAAVVKKAAPEAGAPGGGEEDDDAADAPQVEEITILTLKDDRVLRGRARDLGEQWELATDLGTIRIDKRQVKDVKTELVARAAAPAAPTERTEARDEALGIVVARPSPAWRVAERVPDPLARLLIRRSDPDVYFRVGVAESLDPQHREVEAANLNDMRQLVTAELTARFRAFRALQIAPDRFHGLPVWRVSYQADTRVFGSKFVYRELRLHYLDADLVLQAYAPADAAAAAAPEMDAAFAAFAFTGPVIAGADAYVDRELGFRLARPRAAWRIAPRLLDDAVPVEVLSPDGEGRYAVEVGAAAAYASAQQAADEIAREVGTREKLFRPIQRSDRSIEGHAAVELRYQNLVEGSRLEDVRRVVMVRGGRAVQLVAAQPADLADPVKAADRAAALDALIQGFGPLEVESPSGLYRRAARAIELRAAAEKKMEENKLAAAIDDLSAALDIAPSYGLALVLRGKAYADSHDQQRALRDFDAASDLLDDPALGRMIARVQSEEAKRLVKDDYKQALRLFRAAMENDPASRVYKEDLFRAMIDHARGLEAAGKHDQAISELREAQARYPGEQRFSQELVKAYLDWARKVQGDGGDLYRVRAILKRGLKIAPADVALKAALERIERDIKKKEEGAAGGKKPPRK